MKYTKDNTGEVLVTSFTNGPFKISQDNGTLDFFVVDKSGAIIAYCSELCNAYLLSSAPELYAAVEALIPWVCKGLVEGAYKDTIGGHMVDQYINTAKSALAKARGENA